MEQNDIEALENATLSLNLIVMIKEAIRATGCETVKDVQWLLDGMVQGAKETIIQINTKDVK